MASFVNYLIESGISLSLFALVYFLFLRRETFFNVNRWFLLVSVGFSAILPLLHIPVYTPQPVMLPEVTVTPYINLLSVVTIYGAGFTQQTETFVLSYSIFGYIYLLGVVFFTLKLSWQLRQIYLLIHRNQAFPEGKIKLVVLDREISPFSFLNYIFVSNNLRKTEGWENMLEHERQHIHQGHTFDVLVLELIAVIQWFNPFFWLFSRALRENHEFLADQAVLAHGIRPSWYKQILINQYVGDQIVLANNFNYSLIKTRIKMMSKIKSKKIASIKLLTGVLIAASLIVVFACEQKEGEKNGTSPALKTENLEFDGYSLQLSGDSVAINKLKSVLEVYNNYKVIRNLNSEGVIVTSQSIPVTKSIAPPPPPVTDEASKKKVVSGDEVFYIVEDMPAFPGGDAALLNYLAKQVKYPVVAQENAIQGKVLVSFIVEKDGSVSNAKIVRAVDPVIDNEALRVVSTLPKWKPGKQGGKEVRVSYTVPINFVLQ